MAKTDICQKWWAFMGDIMPSNDNTSLRIIGGGISHEAIVLEACNVRVISLYFLNMWSARM